MRSIFVSSAAVLALVAGAAVAAPGDDARGGGDKAAHGKADGGKTQGNPGSQTESGKKEKANAGPARAEARQDSRQSPSAAKPQDRKSEAQDARSQGPSRIAQEHPRNDRANDKPGRNDNGIAAVSRPPERKDLKRVTYQGPGGRKVVVPTNERVRVITDRHGFDWASLDRRNRYDGCPPGLAKKYNDCTPPGLDRPRAVGWVQPDWYFHDYDRAYRYRYLDGYMLRLGAGDSVLGYIPLLGGALGIGQVWPATYQPVVLPTYYGSYYDLGPADSYRYYGDTIYRIDPDTTAIRSVAALLTGNQIAIGQPMPMGYEVYNVPYAYRDQYYDSPDALYRYSDGYVYQLDPTTRLVQAAIELLV